ncbi:MAG TPA: hypothetical protein VGC79_27885 [Polyangiaceae bacterium]
MIWRIDRTSTERGSVLCISGRIAAEDLQAIRSVLEPPLVVAIELADVDLVDREAVKFLARAEDEGIELRNCPTYIREWITKERVSS